ncbi:MAG: hypothetical protein R2788_17845 [Saprospiraceae bacterium]
MFFLPVNSSIRRNSTTVQAGDPTDHNHILLAAQLHHAFIFFLKIGEEGRFQSGVKNGFPTDGMRSSMTADTSLTNDLGKCWYGLKLPP